jgi:hypothetical protein
VTDSGGVERCCERQDRFAVIELLDLNQPRVKHQSLFSAENATLKAAVAYLPSLAHVLSGRLRALSGLPLEAALRVQAKLLHRPRLRMALCMQAGLPRDDTYGDLVGR